MQKKPTILVIGKEDPDLHHLRAKYNLIIRAVNYSTSPFIQAEEILASAEGTQLDGVVAYNNDLTSIIAAIIAQERHLVGPSLHALYLAQNKAIFSQHMLRKQLPYPDTTIIDITSPTLPRFNYPIFIKPIKGTMCAFTFVFHSQQEFEEKLAILKQQTREDERPFETLFLHFSDAHSQLQNWYHVQPFIDFEQHTVDAFVFDQKVHIIGVAQSIYMEDRKSFARFDFPGDFPKDLTGKLQDLLERVVKTIGFDNCGLDLEFFLSPEGEILIIELNTRISQAFNSLYKEYYVCSPKEMVLDLCLGRMPSLKVKEKIRRASNFALRTKYDCLVKRLPSTEEIEILKNRFDIAKIDMKVEEGKKLSDYPQDPYTYRYGLVDIAGDNLDQIKEKYTLLLEHLPIELQKIEATPPDE